MLFYLEYDCTTDKKFDFSRKKNVCVYTYTNFILKICMCWFRITNFLQKICRYCFVLQIFWRKFVGTGSEYKFSTENLYILLELQKHVYM